MSQHIVTQDEKKYVYGWDQPLMSFYLQVHDTTRSEDDQIVVWLGVDKETQLYEVSQLVHAAAKQGLFLNHTTRVQLHGERDNGI